jgi:hypothetical protein
MSFPLPRRIAKAALLLGAAAAPLVGAGAAQAAAPHQQGLGGLATVDGAGLGSTVDGTSQKATGLAAKTGAEAMRSTLPATGRIVGTTGKAVVPAAQHAAAQGQDAAGRLVGATAESAAGAVPGAETLPAHTPLGGLPTPALPSLDQLPVRDLPVSGLPVSGLPVSGLPVSALPVSGLPVV